MLVIAAGVSSLLAVIVFMVGLISSQRGEKALYYAARREAHRTATRIYSWSLWCLGLGVALFIASQVLPTEDLPTTQAPRVTPVNTDTQLTGPALPFATTPAILATETGPSATAQPAATPSLLPPTAVPAVATPSLAPDIVLLTTPTATTGPAANAQPTAQQIVITVLASDKPLALRSVSSNSSGAGQPISNTAEFVNGTATVYVLFDYHDIPRGTVLRHTWLRNGTSVSFSSAPFSKPGQGTDNVSWTPKGGFTPGVYEVRVALANTLQFTANFLVK